MMELPESLTIASQLNEVASGKRVAGVTVAHTPHKLAWYYVDPSGYLALLAGKTIGRARAFGSMVEVKVADACILFGDGTGIRFHDRNEVRPARHQMLIEFHDGSAVSIAVQMYGGMGAFLEGSLDNPYYRAAREKASPLSPEFDKACFDRMICAADVRNMSMKALLATEQRIPGLGNGILQDILFNARLHPRRKAATLSGQDREVLFDSLKTTVSTMSAQGGRDTELDLFDRPGGYRTILCRNTVNKPCPVCGTMIRKESYMGGTVYYCEKCQTV